MKNLFKKISVLLIVIIALVGCGTNQTQEEVKPAEQTTNETNSNVEELAIELEVINDGNTETSEVVFTEGETALDVTKRELNAVDEGGFVTTINGIEAGEATKTFWALSVNGEMSMVGAADVVLKDGDKITWELSSYAEEVTIELEVINEDNKETFDVAFTEGETALDVTVRELNAVEEGGFVTTINGVEAGEATKTFWALSVNGEMSMVGAAEVILKDGDKITWELSSY